MRLLINIPKEFEEHFQADRFEDTLHRLSADAHLLAGNYEQETAAMLIESFKNAIPIPRKRLIDADELKKIVASAKHMDANIFEGKTMYSDHLCLGADYDDVYTAIDETPTIIPADSLEEE